MLPLASALERLLKRPDGRWQPKIELLTAAQEDISDSKERMSQGTVSPASALTFDDDGSVRLAATGQSYISYNTGAAFFSTLQPILGKDTNHCGMWLFEKDVPGVVLNITKVTLHLSRRPNGGLPPFDGVFRLQAFTVIRNRLTEPSGQEFGNPFLHATVDVAASDVAWDGSHEADVDFVFVNPLAVDRPFVDGEAPATAGRGNAKAFVLSISRGTGTGATNAAWMHDTAQADGEEFTAAKGYLSFWEISRAAFGTTAVEGPIEASTWRIHGRRPSLVRGSVFIRTNNGASATLTLNKPSIIVARKATAGADPPPSVARLTALGYTVTKDLAATLTTCRTFDVVVIDADTFAADEHNAFILSLVNDGQRVLVCGSDSGTGLFYISALSPTWTGFPLVGTAQKLQDHAVWVGVTTMPNDTTSPGKHPTFRPVGDLIIAKPLGTFTNDANGISVVEYAPLRSWGSLPFPNLNGRLLHVPRLALSGSDSDRFITNCISYLREGRQIRAPSIPAGSTVELVTTGNAPLGTTLLTEVWNGSAWVAFIDGQRPVIDLPTVPVAENYDFRITFTGSADNLRSPVLRSIGVRAVSSTDISTIIEWPDVFHQVSDVVECRTEIAELRLTVVRTGPRQDDRDRIADLVTSTANLTASFVKVSVTAPGVTRAAELHLDTFRIDDYDPTDAAVTLVCVSALDRLKLPVPKRQLASSSWTLQPAKYDTTAGVPLTTVFLDVRDGQLGLAARYRGTAPVQGPTDSGGVVRSKIMGQIGVAGVGTAGKTEVAKDVLDQIARIAGGVLVTTQGRIHYRDLFGLKTSVAFFPDTEVEWATASPGLRARSPRFLVSFQPFTLGGTDWAKAIERDDAAIASAVEQAGTEAGSQLDQLPDSVGRWIRVSNPTPLADGSTDEAEGMADGMAHRHVKAFGAGLLLFRFRNRIPYPELEFGDAITVQTRRFLARDPLGSRAIRGLVNVFGVVIGKNLWGTEFLVWCRSFSDIVTAQTKVFPLAPRTIGQVQATVENVDGRPDQALVSLRPPIDDPTVVIRYKLQGPQYARPSTDTTVTNFNSTTGAPHFEDIDEVIPVTADVVFGTATTGVYVSKLTAVTDPVEHGGHFLRFWADILSWVSGTLTLQLRQGYVSEGSQGTLIKSTSITGTSALQKVDLELTPSEAALITNYADLYLRVSWAGVGGESPGIYWFTFECPVAAGSLTPAQSTDTTVWTTYTGAILVARDVANPKFIIAWADWQGAWGPVTQVVVPNDVRPQVTSMTLARNNDGTVTATIQADADSGSVKFVGRKTAFPTAADVRLRPATNARNVSALVVDAATGSNLNALAYEQVFVSALAYTRPNQDGVEGLGVEGPLAQALARQTQDPRPQIASISLARNADASITATIQADDDSGSIKVVARKTGFPSLADVQARAATNGRNVSAKLVDAATGATLLATLFDDIYISAVAYTSTGGAGVEGPLAQAKGTQTFVPPDRPDDGREDISFNGDMELGLRGYARLSSAGAISIETGADRYKGAKSLKLTTVANLITMAYSSANLEDIEVVDSTGGVGLKLRVQPGEIYRIRAAFKSSHADIHGDIYEFTWNENKADLQAGNIGLGWSSGVTSWAEKEVIRQVAAGRYYLALRFNGNSDSGAVAGSAWFDEVHIWRVKASIDVVPGLFDNGTQSANFTIDWAKGDHQRVKLGAAGLTVTFLNPQAGKHLKLEVVQDATGSRTITTWPTAVKWPGGTAPTLTTTANRLDLFDFLYDQVLTNYRGSTVGLNYVD